MNPNRKTCQGRGVVRALLPDRAVLAERFDPTRAPWEQRTANTLSEWYPCPRCFADLLDDARMFGRAEAWREVYQAAGGEAASRSDADAWQALRRVWSMACVGLSVELRGRRRLYEQWRELLPSEPPIADEDCAP